MILRTTSIPLSSPEEQVKVQDRCTSRPGEENDAKRINITPTYLPIDFPDIVVLGALKSC
jgi:hypothetical protein